MDSLKILHRIYFGFDGKVDLYQEYLKTWEEQLPDYKIIHWNADNLPIDICEYTRELFKEKDHAYLSDYFRWWVLREYGGIYLDADIEIINGEKFNILVEELENTSEYHSFIGIDTHDGEYTAHSMACKKKSPLAQYMCEFYENLGILRIWRKTCFVAPMIVPLFFIQHGTFKKTDGKFIDCFSPTIYNNVKIYPKDYFSPISYIFQDNSLDHYLEDYSSNTCLCHHYGSSWYTEKDVAYQKTKKTFQRRIFLSAYLKIKKVSSIKKTIFRNINPSFRNSFLFKIPRMFYRILRFIYHEIKNI